MDMLATVFDAVLDVLYFGSTHEREWQCIKLKIESIDIQNHRY